MKMLQEYFELQKKIYEYFGYVEDWVIIPLDDGTDYFWTVTDDKVWFCEDKETQEVLSKNGFDYDDPECKTDKIYSNSIYTQRFLPKYVYKGEEFTMICVDTHTDGNKFLQIFDNKKNIDI